MKEYMLETLLDLQLHGVRCPDLEPGRKGGAGPAGMRAFLVNGHALMLPVNSGSPAAYDAIREGEDLFFCKDGLRRAAARLVPAPRFYALRTADGVPYKQLALLHGRNCLASTVVQHCARYADPRSRCRFCALEATLASGDTIPRKSPEQLAEVAEAAQWLDDVSHVTLTSGTSLRRDTGILYLGQCAAAIRRRTGLPVQAQFEPPEDLDLLARIRDMGVTCVSLHVESLDEAVRRRVTPGKASVPLERYFETFREAVAVFGRNRVTTFVILGLGEDPERTLEGCRRLIDMGVYPFLTPLRPLPGTPLAHTPPPDAAYLRAMYAEVGAALRQAGLSGEGSGGGCARCGACSLLSFTEKAAEERPRDDVRLLVARSPEELAECRAVRRAVFVAEQHIFQQDDEDDHDADALHILARVNGRTAGVVRCYAARPGIWHGGRLAVLPQFRNNLGALLVRRAVEEMRARSDARRFFALIQLQNVRFFKRLRWLPLGKVFTYHGCAHQFMERPLEREGCEDCALRRLPAPAALERPASAALSAVVPAAPAERRRQRLQ